MITAMVLYVVIAIIAYVKDPMKEHGLTRIVIAMVVPIVVTTVVLALAGFFFLAGLMLSEMGLP